MQTAVQKTLAALSSVALLFALGACNRSDHAGRESTASSSPTTSESRSGTAANTPSSSDNQSTATASSGSSYGSSNDQSSSTSIMGAAGEKIDDAKIVTKVKTSLAADKDLSALKIDVDSKNGVVTLTGTAPDGAAKDRATEIAKNTKDVKDVKNELKVKKG